MAMRVGGLRAVLLGMALVGAAVVPRAGFAAAPAERKNVVEKLADDAAAAYKAGDYQRAVELLERAYATQPLSALLYNLAKAHDKLGNGEKARSLYQKYAAADDADPKLRARAEQRIAALRAVDSPRPKEPAAVASTEPPPSPRPPPPAEPKTPPRAPPPPPQETVLITPSTFEPPPVDPLAAEKRARWRDRGLAITFGVIGIGAVGAAIGMSLSALDLQRQFDRSLDENLKRTLRDDAKTRALVADILYPVGAVAIAVGAVFLWRGLRPLEAKRADKPTVQLAPALLPGGGGVAAGGTF
jgi:tetratricopeptide (TPR) repeat protein